MSVEMESVSELVPVERVECGVERAECGVVCGVECKVNCNEGVAEGREEGKEDCRDCKDCKECKDSTLELSIEPTEKPPNDSRLLNPRKLGVLYRCVPG